jgi:hypothetical protein
MWVLCPENVDQIQRPSQVAKKTIATLFFNGRGLSMIDVLPQHQKMDAGYVAEPITPSLVSICYPMGKSGRQRKCVAHFDNAPIHNS